MGPLQTQSGWPSPGEAVAVESYGKWYSATVVGPAEAGRLHIRYDHSGLGWWSNRDEVVPRERVQPPHAVKIHDPYRAALLRAVILLVVAGLLAGGTLLTRPYWDHNAARPDPSRGLAAGDQVQIHWKGAWYDGRILEIQDDGYLVSYDGYDESWNEVVSADRIRFE